MTVDAAAPRFVLPRPFDHVPVRVGPAAVDAAVNAAVNAGSLHELNEFVSLDDNTVVFRNDLITLVVEGTSAVSIDVRPGVHDDLVDATLYGYAMRLLFLHAGVFNLHGSLVRVTTGAGERTVAIAGHGGAGKSTTVSYLAATSGASILIDDVVPITIEGGVAVAHPFERPVHLLPDAAIRLGMDATAVSDDPSSGIGKVVADLASASGPVAIDQLVVVTLGDSDASEPLTITTVTGAERLRYVVRASNSTGLTSFGKRADAYVAWAMQVAAAVEITHIVRAPGADTLDAIACHIAG
jgi:hypothetical protein